MPKKLKVESVEVVAEKAEVVVESRFKCDNCEDSGMVCYKCNHK